MMTARFPWRKQPKFFPVDCIGTRQLSDLIWSNDTIYCVDMDAQDGDDYDENRTNHSFM